MKNIRKRINCLEINNLETSNQEDHFLISYNNRNFEVNRPIANLILALQKDDSLEKVAEEYTQLSGRNYKVENIEYLIKECLAPIIFNNSEKEKVPFIFHKDLLSVDLLKVITDKLKFFFNLKIIIVFCIVSITLNFLFFLNFTREFDFSHINIFMLFSLIILFIFSTFMHELGHASACKYYNINHGSMGFGIYLIIPVFYTDVSNIWRLKRKQRLLVNFAGIYFQLILLIPVIISYIYTNNDLFKYFIFISNMNFLITLNPIVKFDGYWILSDILGIPNLRERTFDIMTFYYDKIIGNKTDIKPVIFNIKPISKAIAILYTMIVNIFFIYVFCYIIPVFIYNFFLTIPEISINLLTYMSNGYFPGGLFYLFTTKILMLSLIIYLLIKFLKSIVANKFAKIKKNPF